MRGKVFIMLARSYFLRITPAYAGKRHIKHMLSQTKRDHPRLCGEKLDGYSQSNFWTGSPPPMRGKADKFLIPSTCVRITPAYAGKSFFATHSGTEFRDHPRLCGEKYGICGRTGRNPGITPAYAGKRSMKSVLNAIMQDHPRLCGEKQRLRGLPAGNGGSPPPMRGKANSGHMKELQNRITPAYAGKSSGLLYRGV